MDTKDEKQQDQNKVLKTQIQGEIMQYLFEEL